MKNSTLISLIALLVSVVGLMIALVAYFKKRSCVLCDDLEDDLVEFYGDDDDCCCGNDCCCDAPVEVAPVDAAVEGDIKF